MKIRNYSAALIALLFLSSCTFFEGLKSGSKTAYKAPEPDYLNEKATTADIKKFFNGDIESFAITQDKSGKINGTYTAKISARWDGNRGTIEQKFKYNDGKQAVRTWLITVEPDQTFTAVGHDITVPSRGNKQIGNAIQMIYTLSLPVADSEDSKSDVRFEDMMYQIDDKSMILISNVKGTSNTKIIASLRKLGTTTTASKSDKTDDK